MNDVLFETLYRCSALDGHVVDFTRMTNFDIDLCRGLYLKETVTKVYYLYNIFEYVCRYKLTFAGRWKLHCFMKSL